MSATTPPASALSTASSKRPASPDHEGVEGANQISKKPRGDGEGDVGANGAGAGAQEGGAGEGEKNGAEKEGMVIDSAA